MDPSAAQSDISDPFCDPKNPKKICFQDIEAARERIKDTIIKTPCNECKIPPFPDMNMKLFFKMDFLQSTGRDQEPDALQNIHNFEPKERGARNALENLVEENKRKGVIAASSGNHAIALAYHGNKLGIPVTVIMPKIAPTIKIQACRRFNADVKIHGNDISESQIQAQRIGREKGLVYINGSDHPDAIAGQGTMGLEIIEQVPDVDVCIIPVGGGGLIAGTAVAMKGIKKSVQIIGVESEKCPSFTEAQNRKTPTKVQVFPSIADGLAVPLVGVNAFETASKLIDRMITVKEESIALAILRLIELERVIIEGAGAAGLAALLEGNLSSELKGKTVVVPLCGGNIDTTTLGLVIERGLTKSRRLLKFSVRVWDRPGGISRLIESIADTGVNIKDIYRERGWLKPDIFFAKVTCVVETQNEKHSKVLKEKVEKDYENIEWEPELA